MERPALAVTLTLEQTGSDTRLSNSFFYLILVNLPFKRMAGSLQNWVNSSFKLKQVLNFFSVPLTSDLKNLTEKLLNDKYI
jgi:hypothetical protein